MKPIVYRRLLAALTLIALLLSCFLLPVSAEEAAVVDFPEAAEDDSWYDANMQEYEIATAAQLAHFYRLLTFENVSFAGKTVRLVADIVWNEGVAGADGFSPALPETAIYRWNPMGSTNSPGSPFMGIFDGQGYSISGLYMSKAENNVGFFNVVKNSTIKNLSIVNSYLSIGDNKWYAGTLAVQAMGSRCTFENIYVQAYHNNGNATQFIGGICGTVGLDTETVFTNCVFDGHLTGTAAVGGILGSNRIYKTTMTDCVNLGSFETVKESGGVIGRCSGEAVLTRCHNFGRMQVTNDSYAGALLYLERKNHNTNLNESDGTPTVTLTDCYVLEDVFIGGALALHNARFWFTVKVGYTGSGQQSHSCVGGATGEDRKAENATLSAMCRILARPAATQDAPAAVYGCQERMLTGDRYAFRVVGLLPQSVHEATEVGFSCCSIGAEGLSGDWQDALTEKNLGQIEADFGKTVLLAADAGAASFFTLVEDGLPRSGMQIFFIRAYTGSGAERSWSDAYLILYINGEFRLAERL